MKQETAVNASTRGMNAPMAIFAVAMGVASGRNGREGALPGHNRLIACLFFVSPSPEVWTFCVTVVPIVVSMARTRTPIQRASPAWCPAARMAFLVNTCASPQRWDMPASARTDTAKVATAVPASTLMSATSEASLANSIFTSP